MPVGFGKLLARAPDRGAREGSDMSFEHILYSVADRVATITLNRPDKLNAWTATMEAEVRQALTAAAGDEGVRAIVLTGAGRGFCAGADMGNLASRAALGAAMAAAAPSTADGDFDQRYSYLL